MILDTILASTRLRVAKAKQEVSPAALMKRIDNTQYDIHSMKHAIKEFNGVSIIGEIKKASPSKGLIRPDFHHMELARIYHKAQIQAMSILTEPEFFKGNIEFIRDIREITQKPLLRKDFIIDEYQIYEARAYGADAVLLIMAALTDWEYAAFYQTAEKLGLEVLVETHNKEEVLRASEYAQIVGVNNRNLQTFEEDIHTTERLLPFVPKHAVTIAESAVRTAADFEYLRQIGVDGALIGEAFMRAADPAEAVRKLRCGA